MRLSGWGWGLWLHSSVSLLSSVGLSELLFSSPVRRTALPIQVWVVTRWLQGYDLLVILLWVCYWHEWYPHFLDLFVRFLVAGWVICPLLLGMSPGLPFLHQCIFKALDKVVHLGGSRDFQFVVHQCQVKIGWFLEVPDLLDGMVCLFRSFLGSFLRRQLLVARIYVLHVD